MDELILISPSMDYKEDALDFLEEVKIADKDTSWQYAGMSSLEKCSSYEEWLEKINKELNKETLLPGRVVASTYFTVRKSDNRIVGFINIRHELNEFLYNIGGHIGYSVRPSERGKGYGAIQLFKGLEKCMLLGIEDVLVTCDEENIASRHTIEKCFGTYENKVLNDDGVITRRYWINTKRVVFPSYNRNLKM